MADGCDRSWQVVTEVWLHMYWSLCLHEASTSVRCIQTDLLRETEESARGRQQVCKGGERQSMNKLEERGLFFMSYPPVFDTVAINKRSAKE